MRNFAKKMMVKVFSINGYPRNISIDNTGNRVLVSREDGYISIIDEKSLESEDYLTHVCGEVDSVCTVRSNHKYVVTWERGLLVYGNYNDKEN